MWAKPYPHRLSGPTLLYPRQAPVVQSLICRTSCTCGFYGVRPMPLDWMSGKFPSGIQRIDRSIVALLQTCCAIDPEEFVIRILCLITAYNRHRNLYKYTPQDGISRLVADVKQTVKYLYYRNSIQESNLLVVHLFANRAGFTGSIFLSRS